MERSDPAAVSDVTALVNYVDAFGPCGVRVIRGVAHVVDSEGQGEFKSLGEIIRDNHALLQRFRLGIADVVFHVRFHLPFVGGMRFANVNGQKIGAVLVIVINLNDVAHLATERRSSKTPKHQHQGPVTSSFADVETADAIQRDDPRVRCIAADFQRAAMHVRQGVPHHTVDVLWASRHDGQRDKSSNDHDAKDCRCPFPETIHAILLQSIKLTRHEKDKSTQSRRGTQTGPLPPRQSSIEFNLKK